MLLNKSKISRAGSYFLDPNMTSCMARPACDIPAMSLRESRWQRDMEKCTDLHARSATQRMEPWWIIIIKLERTTENRVYSGITAQHPNSTASTQLQCLASSSRAAAGAMARAARQVVDPVALPAATTNARRASTQHNQQRTWRRRQEQALLAARTPC